MSNLWDDVPNEEEFRDVPVETTLDSNGQAAQAAPVQLPTPVQQYRPSNIPAEPTHVQPRQVQYNGSTNRFEEASKEMDVEELVENAEEDYTEILNDANLRIEQGRLYQMIMNHDLFEGMEADPKAVLNVQKEIRKFARERMEIMLGMRQERSYTDNVSPILFNTLEVDILKKLASKATNGATESPEANQIAEAVREVPKRKTLNPIGGSSGLNKSTAPKQAQPQKSLSSKPSAPVKRTKNDAVIDQILAEEGLTRADLELEYVGIGKQLNELTPEELTRRQKETVERIAKRKTVKSSSALPMASPEQQEMLAVQRATQISQAPGMAALLAKVSSMPIKSP